MRQRIHDHPLRTGYRTNTDQVSCFFSPTRPWVFLVCRGCQGKCQTVGKQVQEYELLILLLLATPFSIAPHEAFKWEHHLISFIHSKNSKPWS